MDLDSNFQTGIPMEDFMETQPIYGGDCVGLQQNYNTSRDTHSLRKPKLGIAAEININIANTTKAILDLNTSFKACTTTQALRNCVQHVRTLINCLQPNVPMDSLFQYSVNGEAVPIVSADVVIASIPRIMTAVRTCISGDNSIVGLYLREFATLQQLYLKQRLLHFKWQWEVTLPEILRAGDAVVEYLIQIRTSLTDLCDLINSAYEIASDQFPSLSDMQYSILLNIMTVDMPPIVQVQSDIDKVIEGIFSEYSLLIEQQPLQSIQVVDPKSTVKKPRCRKDITSRFSVSLKLFNFGRLINASQVAVPIRMKLINETTAQEIYQKKSVPDELPTICQLSANTQPGTGSNRDIITSKMTQNSCQDILEAEMKNISIISIDRGGKDKNKVANIKFCFLVMAQFPLNNWMKTALTLSAPIIIRSNTAQQEDALACLSWDKYFSNILRLPFEVEAYASWLQIADMLQAHMKEWTGLSLSKTHLRCLRSKLFNQNIDDDETDILLPLDSLYNEKMSRQDFSFWTWFYREATIFKTEYFNNLWKEGYILGFISKEETEQLLKEKKNSGTFIVRCSDSTLPGLSIAFFRGSDSRVFYELFTVDQKTDSEKKAKFLETIHETFMESATLEVKTLEPVFRHVYPDIDKDIAFHLSLKASAPPINQKTKNDAYLQSFRGLKISN